MSLSRDDRFGRLWVYFGALQTELQEQINSPLTPKDERELKVHLMDALKREVIDVAKVAETLLRKKDQLTGQA
jgi:hypothetical protein